MKLLAVLLLALSVRLASAGECADAPLTARPLTTDQTAIPSDGGILVAYQPQAADEPQRGLVKDWRLVDGAQRTAPRVTPLAPGLERLQPVGTQLVDGKGASLLRFSAAKAAGPVLDAPAATAVVRTTSEAGRRRMRVVSVALATAAPADRILVVFDKAGKVARSWGRGNGSPKVAVFGSGGCTLVANGTIESQVGDEVRLAWVDRTGRLSGLSAPITVTTTDRLGPGPTP